MAPDISALPSRRGWHPVTVASGLSGAAAGLAGTGLVIHRPGWLILGSWLLIGAIAGYAVSGST